MRPILKMFILCVIGCSVFLFLPEVKDAQAETQSFDINSYNSVPSVTNYRYYEFLEDNQDTLFPLDSREEIKVTNYYNSLTMKKNSEIDYKEGFSVQLDAKETLTLNVSVSAAGLYRINYDYYDVSEDILPSEASVLINGKTQYYESKQVMFLGEYLPDYEDFSTDRYDNEIPISFTKQHVWMKSGFKDGSKLRNEDLLFYLEEGSNTLSISLNSGCILFGNFYLEAEEKYQSYEDYLASYPSAQKIDGLMTTEVEYIDTKNDLAIGVYSDTNPSSTRYSMKVKLMNAVNGGNFSSGNSSLGWEIDVAQAGLYQITFKSLQNGIVDLPVGRDIIVNGEIPFDEFSNYQFYYSKKYVNTTLGNEDGAFYIYLEEGHNTLEMRVNLETYLPIIEGLNRIMEEIRSTSLAIKKITGGVEDQYRDWNLTKYMPEITDKLKTWQNELRELETYGNSLSRKKGGSGELYNLGKAIDKFDTLLKDPNQLPNKMNVFSDGTSSISQLLGDLSIRLNSSPLSLEKMYLHDDDVKLPKPVANVFVSGWHNICKFFLSFTSNAYSSGNVADDEIDVWVRRSRQFVEIMQKMIDEDFTENTGIKVKLSVMPDENKLVLANAAGDVPDIAMGVNNWIPYELALRGLAVDFRTFDGYEELIANHTAGTFIPYAYQDGIYGIPETQDFWVSYYRTDILNSIGVDYENVNTWNDVIDNLPLLQSYGMNYYQPLAGFVGLKPFVCTLPFIYQFGGNLYSEDGTKALINNDANIEALKYMTDLFSIYSMPEQVASFYNDFRYGTLPMGVANSGTYTQLLVAAPEIKGNWELGLHPGIYNEEQDEVLRYASTGSQGIMMFEKSKKQEEGFEFLKWWMSTEVQKEYIYSLTSSYGSAYLWFSANTEAFNAVPIPQDHKDVILEQWEWAMEASRVPGAYMVEREISDAFSKIIFNGLNPRTALDAANITANMEITRKMEEFGYMKDGIVVKPHIIPNLYNIEDYLKERE